MSYGLLQLLGLDVARQDIQGTLFDKLGISGAQQPEQVTQPVQPQVQPTTNVQPPVSDVELAPIPVAQTMNNSQPFTDGIDLSGRGYNQPTMRDINTPTIPTMPPEPTPTVTPEPTPEPSFMDKVSEGASDIGSSISNFWNDPEKMANLTIALNSMRLNPDPNIATAMENKLKSIREMKGGNKTVIAIQNLMNKPGISEAEKYRLQAIIDGVRDGVITPADAYTQALKRESAPLVQMGDKADMEFIKAGIADAKTQIESGYAGQASLQDIGVLRELGENPVLQEVPDFARGLIPEGFSSALDAYVGQLNRVAKGQRTPGEGPMTDQDFKVLKQSAGSASMSLEGRRIMQAGLQRHAENKMARAELASKFMAQQIGLGEYRSQMSKLMNQPLFTPEQRKLLTDLNKQSYQTLTQGEKEKISAEKWNDMTPSQRETFITLRGK